MKRAFALLLVFCVLVVTRGARAERTDIHASVDTSEVELGGVVTYSVGVHGDASPSETQLGPHAGFSVLSSGSLSTQTQRMVGGHLEEIEGTTAQWRLRADKLGTLTLGPSIVVFSGQRKTTPAVRVTVTARGSRPSRPSPSPFDPFAGGGGTGPGTLDPFKSLFGLNDDVRPKVEAPTADPRLGLDEARAPVAFLHATVNKPQAVVGEQVTVTVYLYADPHADMGRISDVHEATATDFVKRSLIEDETRAIAQGTALVGGRLWNVRIVRKNALFPLKTGRLRIEPMSLRIERARFGVRESEALHVDVSEPPPAARPAGYAMGDVGDFSLQATVTPRAIPRDGAVGIVIELRGTGNFPGQLNVPLAPGVEWLDTQLKEKLGAAQNGRFGGTRTFSYVVRLHREGAVDLGEVRLPFFDPDKRAYRVAKATLGIVDVAPGPTRDAGADDAEEILKGLPKERHALEGPHPETFVTERPLYWGALFGCPVACAFAVGAHGLLRRARERRANAAPSEDRLAKERRAEADAACRGDDAKAAMGAIARAVQATILASTGVNLRGASGEGARSELEQAGIEQKCAREVLEVLRGCEDARFSPEGVTVESARATWDRAKDVLARAGGKKA